MAKVVSDEFIDGGLTANAGAVTLTVCAGQPISQADIAVKALATHTLTGGDWSISDGAVSGRRITMAQQVDIPITTPGTADHIAVDDGTGYTITTCASTVLSTGTVTVNAFDREIVDPT